MQFSELRKKYPQYDDLSDQQLADGFYQKFYSDMERDKFNTTIGFNVAEKPQGLIDALISGTERTGRGIATTGELITGDIEGILKQTEATQAIGKTPEQEAFSTAIDPEVEGFLDSLGEVVSAAWENPLGALHETVAQAPNMAAVLSSMYLFGKAGGAIGTAVNPGVGTLIGVISGGIIGMMVGNTVIETGFIAQEKAMKAKQKGEAFSDQDRIDSLKQGAIKGGVITAVDAATLGLNKWFFGAAGRAVEGAITRTLMDEGVDIASKEAVKVALGKTTILEKVVLAGTDAFEKSMTVGKRGGRGAVAMSLETLSEGVGEFAGSKAAGLDATYTDAILEAMLATPMSMTEMYVAKKLDSPGRMARLTQEAINKGVLDAEEFDVPPALPPPAPIIVDPSGGATTQGQRDPVVREVKGIIEKVLQAETVEDAIIIAEKAMPFNAPEVIEPILYGRPERELIEAKIIRPADYLSPTEGDLAMQATPPVTTPKGEKAPRDATGINDPFYEEAAAHLDQAEKPGIGVVSRKIRVGYARAAQIFEAWETSKEAAAKEAQLKTPEAKKVPRGTSGIDESVSALEKVEIQLEERKKRFAHATRIKPEDSLLVMAAKSGGLNIDRWVKEGLDPADIKDRKFNSEIFGRPKFKKTGGMSPDELGELMWEHGYTTERLDAAGVIDLVVREVLGEKVYNPTGQEFQAGLDQIAQEEAEKERYAYDPLEFEDLTRDMDSEQEMAFHAETMAADYTDDNFVPPEQVDYESIYNEALANYDDYRSGIRETGEPGAEAAKADELELTIESEEERRAREKAEQDAIAAEAAEKKASADRLEADEQISGFTLTGSGREADVLAAHGQQDLLEQPAAVPEPPIEKIDSNMEAVERTAKGYVEKAGQAWGDIEIVSSDERRLELRRRYGLPNAVGRDGLPGFGAGSGNLFIDDETGKYIAYQPPRPAAGKIEDFGEESGKLPKGIEEPSGGQADLFTQKELFPDTDAAETRAPGVSRGLYPAADLSPDEARQYAKENYSARVKNVEQYQVNVGTDTITSPSDAAHIFSAFRKKAQEHMVVVVTDSDGKILGVQLHQIGGPADARIEPGMLIGAALDVPGGKNIWFGHNHPSGLSRLSTSDMRMTNKLTDMLNGSELKPQGMLAIGTEGAGFYNSETMNTWEETEITPLPRRKAQSVTGREYVKHGMGEVIVGPADLKKEAEGIHRDGVMLLNNQHAPVGFHPMTEIAMMKLRGGIEGGSSELFTAFHKTNATAFAVIFQDENAANFENIQAFLSKSGTVVDVLIRKADGEYTSLREQGALDDTASDAFFSLDDSLYAGKETQFTKEQAEAAIAGPVEAIGKMTGTNIEILHYNDVSPELKDAVPAGKRPKGYTQGNTVYLVYNHISSRKDAQLVLAHELKGHLGVEKIVDDWTAIEAGYNNMKKLGGKEFTSIRDEVVDRYGEIDSLAEVKEFIAIAAERQVKTGVVGKFLAKVRDAIVKGFRKLGFSQAFSMTDINTLLSRSEQYLKGEAAVAPEAAPAFSLAEDQEMKGAISMGLPMDKASRMERAREMGFDTEKVLYHGSKQDIESFVPGYDDGLVFLTTKQEFAGDWIGKGKLGERVGDESGAEQIRAEQRIWAKTIDWSNYDNWSEEYRNEVYKKRNEFTQQASQADSVIYPVYVSIRNTFDPRQDYLKIEEFLKQVVGLSESVAMGQHKTGNWIIYERKDVVDELSSMGYDSMLITENVGGAHDTLAVFDSNQIRSVNAAFDPEFKKSPELLASMAQAPTGPTFYSGLSRAVGDLKQKVGTPQQMFNMLKKQPGVKSSEIEALDVAEFVKAKEDAGERLSKADLQEYVDANGVQVDTKVLEFVADEVFRKDFDTEEKLMEEIGDDDQLVDKNGNLRQGLDIRQDILGQWNLWDTKTGAVGETIFSDLTLPGGANYREVLLTLPGASKAEIKKMVSEAKRKQEILWTKMNAETETEKRREIYAEIQQLGRTPVSRPNEFMKGHFDEPNVLLDLRVTDRTGPNGEKILFIEELQSDWHQAGRKRGYAQSVATAKDIDLKYVSASGKNEMGYWESHDKQTGELIVRGRGNFSEEEAMIDAVYFANQARRKGVPDAPFKGNAWVELGLKKALRMAAEEGYDSIAWTPGQVQADRYDLSKQVESIDVIPRTNVATGEITRSVEIVTPSREGGLNLGVDAKGVIDNTSAAHTEWKGKALSDVVGKDMADKIMAADVSGMEPTTFKGEDLKIGGEGMISFYDQLLPNLMKKVARKMDKKVGLDSIAIDTGGVSGRLPDRWTAAAQSFKSNGNTATEARDGIKDAYPEATDSEIAAAVSEVYGTSNVQFIPVTDAMRTAAMAGQPLFSLDNEVKKRTGETRKTPFKGAGKVVGPFRFNNAKTEMRFRAAKMGLADQRTIVKRFSDGVDTIWRGFSRRHIDLPNKPEFALANEALRQYEAAPQASKEEAIRQLKNIVDGLSRDEYDLFTRKVILDDLAFEVEMEHDLPFDFTPESLDKDRAELDEIIKQHPKIQQSLNYRSVIQDVMRRALVEAGILSEESVNNPAYFRHQVLTYARARQIAQGTTDLRKPKPGYAKRRHGTIEDINANYLEAEFEYLHRALIDMKAVETIRKIGRDYDITADLKSQVTEKAKITNQKEDWRDLVPEGYRLWQPDKGNVFYTGLSLPERMLNKLMDETVMADLLGRDVDVAAMKDLLLSIRKAVMLGGKKYEMTIPEEIAATLDQMRPDVDNGLFDTVLAVPLKYWKQWTLISPRRVLKYNINNISGDLDAVIAGSPKATRRLGEAIKELYGVMHGKEPSARYKEAVERGVFDAGLTVQEIPDINLLDPFAHLIEQPTLKQPMKFTSSKLYGAWKVLRDYTRFRENWLRYAAYLDYVDRLEGGESMSSVGYGASNPKMVDEVLADNVQDGAALLARDLVGDYGDVSHYGQGVRKKVIPFYSWLEVNTRRYVRLLNNAYTQGIGKGIAATSIVGVSLGARTSAYLGIRMVLLYTSVQLWNNLFHGDDEDDLSDSDRVRLHINLGKDEDGQIRTLRFQGALSDFLQWFGAEDAVASYLAIEKGRADWTDVLKSIAKGPINRVASGLTPVIKLPMELLSGLSFWPDTFNPRAIRDRGRHTARLFGMENEYDWLLGKPSRGYLQSLEGALVYKRDAGEMAYNKVRGLAFEWQKRTKGTGGVSTYTSPRSQAMYEWRLAKKFGDEKAEATALATLKKMGVTGPARLAAKKRAHPLGSLAKKDRAKFRKTLSPREKKSLDSAEKWYREVYYGT